MTLGTPGGASIAVDGVRDALFWYRADGTLQLSISPTGGTDSFGHVYQPGVYFITPSGTALEIADAGMTMKTTNANVDLPVTLTVDQVGGLDAAFDEFDLEGARDSTFTEQWFLTLRSASKDGTSRAQALLRLLQGAHVTNALLADFAGAHILGDHTAVQPGTGTALTPAVAESWHTVAVNANWTTIGTTTPLRVRKEGTGPAGVVRLDGQVITTGAGPWGAGSNLGSLGSGYAPPFIRRFITPSGVLAGAGSSTVQINTIGQIITGVTYTAAGQSLYFDGVTFPLD
ncbi:MAG: hypothetical protein ACRDVE_18025 [Actinocrinis sp.]